MKISLIGKALNFGFKEYRFESYIFNINVNQFNLLIKLKIIKSQIYYNIINFKFISFLKQCGLIKFFYIFKKKENFYIKFFLNFYKLYSIFKKIKWISNKKKYIYIKFKTLKLLFKKTLNSILIISTKIGLVDQFTAYKLKIGGKIIGILY